MPTPTGQTTTGHTSPAPAAPRPLLVYLDLTGLLLTTMATPVLGSAQQFATLSGLTPDPGTARLIPVIGFVTSSAMLFWLGLLVIGRRAPRPTRLAAILTATATLYLNTPGGDTTPLHLSGCATGITTTWLTLEILHRHGIGPRQSGISPPDARTPASRLTAWNTVLHVVTLCALTTAGVLAIRMLLPHLWPSAPMMRITQTAALGWTSHWQVLPDAVYTVALEDVVLVGAITTLLTAARRPTWVIVTLVSALEITCHLYFGMPALAMVPFAWYRVRLYQRHHRLTPLMTAHAAFDVTAALAQLLPLPARMVLGGCVGVGICLVDRRLGKRAAADTAIAG